jgi:hypothetical protein
MALPSVSLLKQAKPRSASKGGRETRKERGYGAKIMAVLADGGGGDGEISNVRKKGPIYLSLFPASRKNDFLLFFSY